MPPSTSGRKVPHARGPMRRTASSPASMSTPASRYVNGFMRATSGVEETKLRCWLGLDADAVGAREAGVAEVRRVGAGRLQHAVEREIAERVGGQVAADLLDRVAGADQLLARRRVDAVVARPLDGRRGDADVDGPGAGAADHLH